MKRLFPRKDDLPIEGMEAHEIILPPPAPISARVQTWEELEAFASDDAPGENQPCSSSKSTL